MDDLLLLLLIAALAGGLTALGAPLAEYYTAPRRLVSAALQFAAGIIAALVALSLMPPAVREAPLLSTVAFFLGGTTFVLIDTISARRAAARPPAADGRLPALGLYIGVLVDLFIDGVVIGVSASITLASGLLLALGISISTLPLAFVTTSLARSEGLPARQRRWLGPLYFACLLGGALLGFLLLRNQPLAVRLAVMAFAAGFLLTTVTQSLIPAANHDGEPTFAGILFVGGMSLYALLTLAVG